MIKKNRILFLLLISLNFHYSQTDSVYYGNKPANKKSSSSNPNKNRFQTDKVIYGGNFMLLFGNYTFINLTPSVGYRFTEKFHAGVGVIYNYSSTRYGNRKYYESLYGTHVFARYIVSRNLFLQGQYDRLNQPNYLLYNHTNERIWVNYVMVGGGFIQPIGDHVSLMTSILYNLTPSPLSVYYNPYFQVGIVAGF